MNHLKKYENIFDNINDIYDERFWENVIQKFGNIISTKATLELDVEIDDDLIEFGIDYNNQIYIVNFSVSEAGNWTLDVHTYPDLTFAIRSTKIKMRNDPDIMAAFLSVIMP